MLDHNPPRSWEFFLQTFLVQYMQICTLLFPGNNLHQCAGKHGCVVVVTGRRLNVLTDAQNALRASGVEVLGLQGDVRSADDCAQWVQQTLGAFGKLHILVNCAAGVASSDTPVQQQSTTVVQFSHGVLIHWAALVLGLLPAVFKDLMACM
jgi:NAD(P)-dependent dehydrogenase (short-subunit alcohol dehydrogenase family)